MNRLKELRLKRGLTLKQLSGCLNDEGFYIAPDTLAKYERGDRKMAKVSRLLWRICPLLERQI